MPKAISGPGAIQLNPENHVLHELHEAPLWVLLAPMVALVTGLGLAFLLYIVRPDMPARIAAAARPVDDFLRNKWYFDELYDFLFVRPARALGLRLWHVGDQGIIDRFGPDGFSATTLATVRQTVRIQTGYVYHYAFVMLVGVAVLVSWYLFLVR